MSQKDVENSLQFLKESRRAHERFRFETTVTFPLGEEVVYGTSHNLSLGGIFLSFVGTVCVGDTLSLSLQLPGLQSATVTAQVRWVIPKDAGRVGCGLQFLDLSDPLMKAIIQLSANEELRQL